MSFGGVWFFAQAIEMLFSDRGSDVALVEEAWSCSAVRQRVVWAD